jgi:predicted RNA methylase
MSNLTINICDENIDKDEDITQHTQNIQQIKRLKRNTIDKYYTKKNIVTQCIELVEKYINISKDDLIIEPSAGNGSFIDDIKSMTKNYKFYDLKPEHIEIVKQDFLDLDLDELKEKYINIHIIGNPPFGRQASMAIKGN